MCRDFVFVRLHLLAFHFNEVRTWLSSIIRQTVEGSLGFAQTIKTSKVDRWFGLIGNHMDYLRMDGKQYASKVRNKALEDFDWLSQWLE